MPKSRGRQQRKTNRRTTQRGRSSRPHDADLRAQAAAEFPILQATDAAEARGDAWGALQLIEHDLAGRGDEVFWRPKRIERLMQLAALGSALPRWATSRWILAQAAQTLDESSRGRTSRAMQVTLGIEGQRRAGNDDLDRRAKVMDHDWVFREVFLYELGGLQHFLSHVASADLVAGADRIHDWARAPMGGFRLLREEPKTLVWLDLTVDSEVESLNLGAATLVEPGDCVIGRLVPIDEGAMFEAAPLPVPEALARSVAGDPPGWVSLLIAACRSMAEEEMVIVTSGHDFRLLTDVPEIVQQLVFLDVNEHLHGRRMKLETIADLRSLQQGLVRAALDQQLPDSRLGLKPWPSVAATLLDPLVLVALADTARADDGSKFRRLAGLLGGPAGEWCEALAAEVEEAA
jgi:hypothetical protein